MEGKKQGRCWSVSLSGMQVDDEWTWGNSKGLILLSALLSNVSFN